MTSALLVTRYYEPDRRIVKFVEQRKHHAAWVAEHNIDSLLDKRIDNYLSA
jgi:hypothetical protein